MSITTFKVDGFLIVAKPAITSPDHVHEFWAFEEVGHAIEGDREIPVYADMWEEPKTFDGLDLDSMEPAFTGAVKWDGCSNWDFSPDDVMAHFCHPEDMDRLAEAVKACIAKAAELIPNWDNS